MDLAFVHARIVPSPARSDSDAVLVRGDRIARVGASAEILAAAGEAEVIDLRGRILAPGFQDAHFHFLQFGITLGRAALGGCTSLGQFRAGVAEALETGSPDGVLVVEGWDETAWTDPVRPTRADLDALAPDRPVIARRICGHVGVANGPALALLADRWTGGGVDRASGLLDEGPVVVLDHLFPPTPDEAREAVARAGRRCLELGITSAADFPHPNELPLWQELARDELPVRVNAWPRVPAPAEVLARIPRTDRFRLCGTKLFSDGAIGGRSAAFLAPYSDRADDTGLLVREPEELQAVIRHEHDLGRTLAVHAIGDRAVREVLTAFAALPGEVAERGHRIEHLELAREEDLARLRELGVVASVQPNFLRWADPGGLYETALGTERLRAMNRFGSLVAAGCRICFGSDGMPAGPLYGIRRAVAHPVAAERIPDETAIRLYTDAAADATPGAKCRGRIAEGEQADLVVLPAMPSDFDSDEVDLTILDGRIVHRCEGAEAT